MWNKLFVKVDWLLKGLDYHVTYVIDENSEEMYWVLQEMLN